MSLLLVRWQKSTIKAKPIGSMIFSESDKLSTKIIALSLNETSLSK